MDLIHGACGKWKLLISENRERGASFEDAKSVIVIYGKRGEDLLFYNFFGIEHF